MIRGLYTAASGMNAEMTRQDVVANNLANATTTGFKKDEAVQAAFPNMLIHRIESRLQPEPTLRAAFNPHALTTGKSTALGMLGQGVMTTDTVTNFSDGTTQVTGNPLDLALKGRAMFIVELANGETAYTRAGSFKLNERSELVDKVGNMVVGLRGSGIEVPTGNLVVTTEGRLVVNNREVGQLAIARFDKDADLVKFGEGIWKSASGEGIYEEGDEINFEVTQGAVEGSNVSVIEEMINMITVMRSYEANQKTIQAQDETLGQLISEAGKT